MSQQSTTNQDQAQEREEEINLGYETPTAEEHRIPAVNYDSPPPAPKKRKRLFVDEKISVAKVIFVEEKELESFFDLLESESRRQPLPPPLATESESEPELGTSPKKIRSDK